MFLQALATTCVVSAALISGAKQQAQEFAKQEADKALTARRSSGAGGGGSATANGNGSSDTAAPAGKKPALSPAKQRVRINANKSTSRTSLVYANRSFDAAMQQ